MALIPGSATVRDSSTTIDVRRNGGRVMSDWWMMTVTLGAVMLLGMLLSRGGVWLLALLGVG
jgi:hypothetical protein